jgi:ribose transport system ATP-binding protein
MSRLAEKPSEPRPLLRISRLSKSFPGVKALADVSLTVRAGEILAIVGHNGSGKSTLVKVLAGVYEPDPGAVIELCDSDGRVLTNAAAREELHFIHQDLGLVDLLTTVENLALSRAPAPGRDLLPSRRADEQRHARELIARFGANFDTTVPVGQLSPAERAIVAIARALDGWTKSENVLVLDEPTTAFHGEEVELLFGAIRRAARLGAGIVFISHRLDEVLGLADRVVVLRDGQVTADEATSNLDHDKIVQLIVGRAVDAVKIDQDRRASEPVLVVRDLQGGAIRDLSLTVRAGEIVGVSGILGSGRDELAGLLFGARHRAGGVVEVAGEHLLSDDPVDAIDAGLAFVPADRWRSGAVMSLSVRENLTIPLLGPLRNRFGALNRRAERVDAASWVRVTGLRPPDPERPVNLLSGGNQQKVVLAKWLRTRPLVLLLDEPTQGVDVGARASIYELIAAAARNGAAVLVCSSDVKELVLLCDRVLVLNDGRVISEVPRHLLTEQRLVRDELGSASGLPAEARVARG